MIESITALAERMCQMARKPVISWLNEVHIASVGLAERCRALRLSAIENGCAGNYARSKPVFSDPNQGLAFCLLCKAATAEAALT